MNSTLITNILLFAGALASLLIIHELGHFVAFKLYGVKVEEFGIGFPPRMIKLATWGGTIVSLNWLLPFGAFVRLKEGEDPNEPGSLAAASPWVRLGAFLAGPIANLITGVLLYTIIFARIGAPVTNQVQVISVEPNSPAALAGLAPGDLLLKVDGQTIDSMDALKESIDAHQGQPTIVEFQRDGQTSQATLTPRSNPPPGQGAIGIQMGNPTRSINIIQALPSGFAAVYSQGIEFLTLPVKLIRGSLPADQGRLVGIKGMFDMFVVFRQTDTTPSLPSWVFVVSFFATITVSLGVLNLLPFPALDGGRILFVLPELLLRRRIPPKYENAINLVGFGLLLLLLIYINLQDFINPIHLPR